MLRGILILENIIIIRDVVMANYGSNSIDVL